MCANIDCCVTFDRSNQKRIEYDNMMFCCRKCMLNHREFNLEKQRVKEEIARSKFARRGASLTTGGNAY